jgi:hypothetical protein
LDAAAVPVRGNVSGGVSDTLEYQETAAAEVDAIVSGIIDAPLLAAGFTLAARRKWVRARPPIRQLFEFNQSKGGWYLLRWSISLDFVPHVKGSGLAWHRTDKSAAGDLIYDPELYDADWEQRWAIDSMHGAAGARRDAERVLPGAVQAALAWFEGVDDIPAVRAKAEWLINSGQVMRAYTQLRLAYAFLLARTGAPAEARAELDRWIALIPQEREGVRGKLTVLLASTG